MFPWNVDPSWYEKYWLSEAPQPKHRSFPQHVARFAVLVAVVAGGGALLSHFHATRDVNAYPSWQQE